MFSADPGEGWGEYRVYGATQTDQYEPLYARVTEDGQTVTRWKFSAEERRAIFEGQDLLLFITTFSNPLQPVALQVEGVQAEQ